MPGPHNWPAGPYQTAVLDPPWPIERAAVRGDKHRLNPDLDYPTMSFEDIAALPVPDLLDDHAFVFIWQIQAYLWRTPELLSAWGLKHRWMMVWIKPGGFQSLNSPQNNIEFVVMAAKGNPRLVDQTDFFTGFAAPRGLHSVKPSGFYSTIARCCPAPRVDIFSRQPRPGFDVWGNEVPDYFQPDGAIFAGPGTPKQQELLL